MLTTKDICTLARKDPVVSLLVPQACYRSLPVPFVAAGRPFIGFYFYPVTGEKGGEKQILTPIARIAMDMTTGRVVEAVGPPLCHAEGHRAQENIGVFPPPALAGRSQQDGDHEYDKYYPLCDRLAKDLVENPSFESCASYTDWRASFDGLREPGLEVYYSHFLDVEILKPRSAGRQTTPRPAQPEEIAPVPDTVAALDLTPHLKDLQSVVLDLDNPALAQKWAGIRKSIKGSAFTVAVVGEFLRGKTSVVNALLGQDVLPVGDAPTTALPTRIAFASDALLLHTQPGQAPETLPLSADALNTFRAGQEGLGPAGSFLTVRLPSDWLRECGIELVDTPGVGADSSEAIESVSALIAKCDATLLCVNATMPLSLTERAFMEDTVLAKSTPRVAIVVTKLDLVPEAERAEVLGRMAHRLEEWDLQVPIWCINKCSSGVSTSTDAPGGPELVRTQIARWATAGDLVTQRKLQAASQAADLCVLLKATIQTQLAAEQTDSPPRENQLRAVDDTWAALADHVDERELELERTIENALTELQQDLKDELSYELSRTRNPREWWDKDLPFRLRRFLKRVKRELQPRITAAVASDTNALNKELAQKFSTALEQPQIGAAISIHEADIIPSPDDLTDLDKIRMWTRIGAGVVTAAGYMLLGAPAMILSLTGGVAGDKAIGGKIEEQRHRLGLALDEVIDRAMQQVMSKSRSELRKIYRELSTILTEKKDAWMSAVRKGAEQRTQPGRGGERLSNLLAQTESILASLNRFLGGPEK